MRRYVGPVMPGLLSALLLLMAGAATHAQIPAPPRIADSSVDRILALATNPAELGAVLRQQYGRASREKLDTLADKLTERTMAAGVSRPTSFEDPRYQTVTALRHAGALPQGRDGTPYDGAAERLIRIHRESPAGAPGRSSAVSALAEVTGFDRSAAYLREVATSRDPTAGPAMQALIQAASPGASAGMPEGDRQLAMEILRSLWNGVAPVFANVGGDSARARSQDALRKAMDTVPNVEAAGALWRFALTQGWRSRDH